MVLGAHLQLGRSHCRAPLGGVPENLGLQVPRGQEFIDALPRVDQKKRFTLAAAILGCASLKVIVLLSAARFVQKGGRFSFMPASPRTPVVVFNPCSLCFQRWLAGLVC